MNCANEVHFFDPVLHAQSRAKAMEGIIMPVEEKIAADRYIYRVGHSDRSKDSAYCGPWWVTDNTFLNICNWSKSDDSDADAASSFRTLYKLKLAVMDSNGACDVIVRARLREKLRAWGGRAKRLTENPTGTAEIIWTGGFEISQLCIPGLAQPPVDGSKDWVKSPEYDQWLEADEAIPIHSWFAR